MEYLIHLAILVGIYTILAQSLNLQFGVGQLFNLAHIASYAIGAYATALLSTESGLGFVTCLLVSISVSGLFSLLIGVISLRLDQEYFAIGTLAFSSLITALLINWKELTRGVLGIPGIPRPELFGVMFFDNLDFLLLTMAIVLLSQVLFYLLFKSSLARVLMAQAESEHAALAIAHNTRLARNLCFFIGSCFAGLAGALFAYYINYIDPSSFSLLETVFVLSIVVVGRPGSFWGCLGATAFLVLLPEPLRFIEISPAVLGPARQSLYAAIMILVVYLYRRRLFPVRRAI